METPRHSENIQTFLWKIFLCLLGCFRHSSLRPPRDLPSLAIPSSIIGNPRQSQIKQSYGSCGLVAISIPPFIHLMGFHSLFIHFSHRSCKYSYGKFCNAFVLLLLLLALFFSYYFRQAEYIHNNHSRFRYSCGKYLFVYLLHHHSFLLYYFIFYIVLFIFPPPVTKKSSPYTLKVTLGGFAYFISSFFSSLSRM